MAKSYAESKEEKYRFWKNKPVMKMEEKCRVSEIIDSNMGDKYKKDVYTNLPDGYKWIRIELNEQDKMLDVSDFLTKYYGRGSDSSYIIKYDPDRLRWEMNNIGYFLSVCSQNLKIIGIIGFTFRNVQLNDDKLKVCEAMYMCCDPKYRGKGLARVLMEENIRQSVSMGVNEGIYCNNRISPSPIATVRQYARPIDYKKLRANDFIEISEIDDDVAHDKTKIKLRPNKKYIIAENNEDNINIVDRLYNKYMKSFNLHMIMTKQEISNYFFDDRYVRTLLIKNDKDEFVDFISYNFYDIYNTQKEENNVIKASNILMYTSLETRVDLIFINVFKQISYDKIYIVYINDMMHSNSAILSKIKNADEDTDDDEKHACFDMNLVKTGKKTFINLFNRKCEKMRQDMISLLLF